MKSGSKFPGNKQGPPAPRKKERPARSSGADPVRRAAHAALLDFHRSPRNAEDLIVRFTASDFDSRDRAFLRELIYGVLRWRNRLDAAFEIFLSEPPDRLSIGVRTALRLGTYQIIFLDRVPDHGAVNTSVELAGRKSEKWAKGLVNAVLRKVSLHAFEPPEKLEDRLTVWESHPRWLVRRWIESLGPEAARARCEANNAESPVVFRVNPVLTDSASLSDRFREEGVSTSAGRIDPDCLWMKTSPGDRHISFTDTAPYAEGAFIAQDEASSLVTRFTGVQSGDRVLDACAAPGGKTAGMSWMAGPEGMVIAADITIIRLTRLKANCARIKVPVGILAMNAGKPAFGEVFDSVLVDAPCSGLGVLRRHPDARWRLKEEYLASHGRTQLELLTNAAHTVRPGGHLTYAVCSNEPEETDRVAEAMDNSGFVRDSGAEFLPPPARKFVGKDGAFRLCPENGSGMDGFFAVRWRREVKKK
jgi:16S rRNA (cytosine967-C5)-methyltransferase